MKEKWKIAMDERDTRNRHKIFVYGSNEAGRNGKGSALHAKKYYGAETGIGRGRTGNAYAIPTKDSNLKVLPLDVIWRYVGDFIHYAESHSELEFFVVAIGTGLAGYSHAQIAPMFKYAPPNCELPPEWVAINKLNEIKRLDSSDEYGTDDRFNLEAKSSHDMSNNNGRSS